MTSTPLDEAIVPNEGLAHDNGNPSPPPTLSTTPDLLEGKTVEELIDIMKQMGPEIAAKKKNGLHIEYLKKVAASLSVRKDLAKQELVHRIFDRLEKKRKYEEMDGGNISHHQQQQSTHNNNNGMQIISLSSSSNDGVGIGGQHDSVVRQYIPAGSRSIMMATTTAGILKRSELEDASKKDNNNNKNLPLLAEVANEIQNDHLLSTNPTILPTTTLTSGGVGTATSVSSGGEITVVANKQDAIVATSKERSQKQTYTKVTAVNHGAAPSTVVDASKNGRQAESSAEEIRQNIKLTITLNLKENEALIRESWLAIAHMKTMRTNALASNDSVEEKTMIDQELARLYNSVTYYSQRVEQLRADQIAHN
eukprot:scaffold654_cov207-Ochromonas_danica.AAC.39